MFVSLCKRLVYKVWRGSACNQRFYTGKTVGCGNVKEGDSVDVDVQVTAKHVWQFCGATGDTNPIHWDPVAARKVGFEDSVVHGVLVVGFVSGVIGTRLPGPGTIVVRQSMNHRAPLYVDEIANVRVEIVKIRKLIEVSYLVKSKNRDVVVLDGVATLKFKG